MKKFPKQSSRNPKKYGASSRSSNAPLELRNPHAVLAALHARPHDVLDIQISSTKLSSAWQRVTEEADKLGRPIKSSNPEENSGGSRPVSDRRNTLAFARVRPKAEVTLKDMLADTANPGVWLAVEHVQDPHNLGAIARTAAFFGVRGLILTKDQSAALTAVAYDIAAGGVESLSHTTITNMSRTIDSAKDAELWVLGTSEHAETSVSEISLDRRWLVIVGNEESGLRRLTKEKCDMLVGVPCAGTVTSLNVSVATGVVLSRFVA